MCPIYSDNFAQKNFVYHIVADWKHKLHKDVKKKPHHI